MKVLFFASLKDIAGESEITLELEDNSTVESLKIEIVAMYPKIEPFMNSVRIAINKEFAEDNSSIENGDELAILPPVSGG